MSLRFVPVRTAKIDRYSNKYIKRYGFTILIALQQSPPIKENNPKHGQHPFFPEMSITLTKAVEKKFIETTLKHTAQIVVQRIKKIKTLSNVSIISMPLSCGLMAVSEEFILTVYGLKWEPVVPLVKVLAFYGMTLSVSSVTGSIFKTIGKPNLLLYTSIFHHILMISLLLLLRGYGVIGICYAVLIPVLVSSTIAFSLITNFLIP